jgi:hypothetical protein
MRSRPATLALPLAGGCIPKRQLVDTHGKEDDAVGPGVGSEGIVAVGGASGGDEFQGNLGLFGSAAGAGERAVGGR